MNCPHCNFHFEILAVNAEAIPDEPTPLICESCGGLSLLFEGVPRRATREEIALIKQSPAWREILGPVAEIIRNSKVPPADRSATTLTDGSPVTADHREIIPSTGQQKGYVVLSTEERAKGFVRPVRDTYTHKTCGTDTFMGRALAETYARDPSFYGATFCCHCRHHFPLTEFVWKGTDEQVGS